MRWTTVDAPRSLSRTLGCYRHGRNDPTTDLAPGRFRRCTHTPDGPGTVVISWTDDRAPRDQLTVSTYGPGGGWLAERIDRLVGDDDYAVVPDRMPPHLERALRRERDRRFGASRTLYHELLPVILAQRITAGEAVRQWHRLVHAFGEPGPGPSAVVDRLRLPPAPECLARTPLWKFHPLGIEESRARALVEVARHPTKLFDWCERPPVEVASKLELLPRVGPWTAWSAIGPALGDPDAVPIGDFHFPNTVAWFLAGEARADDDRMLELLEPYRGQRGRVLRAIVSSTSAPKFGPKRRIVPIGRM